MRISPKVSIIILNWNGLEDTIECLESLKKVTYPNDEVIWWTMALREMTLSCYRRDSAIASQKREELSKH
jgi:GT2 family glycosyltransferase